MATSSKKFSTFLGKNEHLSRSDLQIKEGLYVADAKNVDIALPGRFIGRRGYAKVVPGTNMHSLWVSGTGRSLVVSAGQLCALDVRSKQLLPLDMAVPHSALLAYADLPDGDIAVTDGRTMARIKPDNSVSAMIAPAPSPAPVVSADAGSFTYLYCFAYVDALGVVGLCTQPQTIVGGTVQFDVPVPPAGLRTQIYVSHPNGEVMYLDAQSSGGVHHVDESRLGGECLTLHKQALMPGNALGLHGGRLYAVRGHAIYYSQPYHFGVMAPSNFIAFAAPVTVFAPMPGGCFVVADKTYWLQGADPATADLLVVNEHVGIARSLARLPDGRAVWGSSQGIVVGNGAGEVASLTDAVVPAQRVLPGTTGATLRVERNGVDQIISKRQHPGYGRAGVTMEAE